MAWLPVIEQRESMAMGVAEGHTVLGQPCISKARAGRGGMGGEWVMAKQKHKNKKLGNGERVTRSYKETGARDLAHRTANINMISNTLDETMRGAS